MAVGLDHFAAILAAIVGFAATIIWYRAFGTMLMAALGLTAEQLRHRPATYVVTALAQLVMAYVLTAVIGQLAAFNMQNGIVVAAFLWLGFVATAIAVSDSFAGARLSLTMIDAGHWLVVMVLMGAVIGLVAG